jgi:protein-S-isoprenylcysteine O-methyltransferase Ste14
VFAAHHSVCARPGVKAAVARIVPQHLVRSVYVWTASVLFIAFIALWQPIGGQLYGATGPVALGLLAIQLYGAWLIARSVRAIDALDLAGIRPTASADALQITGPYRLVRHPLYLGWMLIVFGAARMTGDRLVFAAMTSIYLIVAIPWEERSLERAFGDAYTRYKRQVRWRMVPYVY